MEISRIQTSAAGLSIDTQTAPKSPAPQAGAPESTSSAANKPNEPRLEALQSAMRELPDVSFDKVIAIRQALAKGEIDIDSQSLAKLMMTHHRGTEI